MKNRVRCFANFQSANRTAHRAALLVLCLLAGIFAGCSTTKPKETKPEAAKVHQRGWIGGEFKLARKVSVGMILFGSRDELVATLPEGLNSSNRAGILITALGTNTPASQAGLREGDLILACDHHPITSLKAFRQLVDRAEPGKALPVAAWREGRTFDCVVSVGRETFKNWGTFGIGIAFPNFSNFGPFDLWPNPGFDLGPVGFEPTPDDRKELSSPEATYLRECNHGQNKSSDQDWSAWLAIFKVSRGRNILSQEIVPAAAPH
jgi:membrane-associated protease RseP (regulator of RpoE activity)